VSRFRFLDKKNSSIKDASVEACDDSDKVKLYSFV